MSVHRGRRGLCWTVPVGGAGKKAGRSQLTRLARRKTGLRSSAPWFTGRPCAHLNEFPVDAVRQGGNGVRGRLSEAARIRCESSFHTPASSSSTPLLSWPLLVCTASRPGDVRGPLPCVGSPYASALRRTSRIPAGTRGTRGNKGCAQGGKGRPCRCHEGPRAESRLSRRRSTALNITAAMRAAGDRLSVLTRHGRRGRRSDPRRRRHRRCLLLPAACSAGHGPARRRNPVRRSRPRRWRLPARRRGSSEPRRCK